MNIKYILSKTKNSWRISVRMYYGRFDLSLLLPIFVEKESDWDSDSQQLANSSILNQKLSELKSAILREYNQDFTQGVLINKNWLKNVVSVVFNRPSGEENLINNNADIYFTDFGKMWIDKFADKWKVGPKKFMTKVQKSQYAKLIEQVCEFEKVIGKKWILKDLSVDEIYEFVNWLEENEYNSSSIERAVGRIKFFLNRSYDHDLKVSKVRNQRIYIEKEDDAPDKPFLTEEEIKLIINKDFSFDQELAIAKQHYIILLFTGLRGSDGLKKLDISNIENDLIKIKTTKTGQSVVLPLHSEIKKVIKQNFGNLPPKMSLTDFNIAIKKIAQVCEIDYKIEGKLWNSKKRRKIRGFYKKYELLSSHSCRRGFVTLYKDVISADAMASLLGWSSTEMMKVYDQTSKEKYASELEKVWKNNN